MQCIITTPTKTETYSDLMSVQVPTNTGITQIKPGHAEYVANVVAGELLCVTKAGKVINITIDEGVCYVAENTVTVIV